MQPTDKELFIQKMNKLKRVYETCLDEWRVEMEAYLAKAEKWTLSDTTALQALVHKLTGTGSTYGYSQITDAARSLEYKLAYSNLELKNGAGHPNKNPLIMSELRNLIRTSTDIHKASEINRLESSMFGDELDEIIEMSEADRNAKTIMIVDDQEIIRNTLQLALKSAGFNVILAADGDDALLLMQKKLPDLLVLDRMMPHLDGLSVLKTMRKLKTLSDVPVIFLTALYSPTDILEAENLGAVDYVTKPFDVDEFTLKCIRLLQ